MPASSTARHKGITLTFTEADHKYTDDRGVTYTSVTTFLHQFFEPFDPEANAARMEAQGKGVASELIAGWERKRDEACEYGTRVHEVAEAALRGEEPPHQPRDERERLAFASVWSYSKKKILPAGKVIGPELMVFHPYWWLSGTIDLPVKLSSPHRSTDGTVCILDWKTNGSIDREGFRGKMALDPISHLPDCNFTKYALQLNIYQQILLHGGYLPFGTKFKRGLLWVPPGENRVEYMEVPDLTAEALSCIALNLCAVPF